MFIVLVFGTWPRVPRCAEGGRLAARLAGGHLTLLDLDFRAGSWGFGGLVAVLGGSGGFWASGGFWGVLGGSGGFWGVLGVLGGSGGVRSGVLGFWGFGGLSCKSRLPP